MRTSKDVVAAASSSSSSSHVMNLSVPTRNFFETGDAIATSSSGHVYLTRWLYDRWGDEAARHVVWQVQRGDSRESLGRSWYCRDRAHTTYDDASATPSLVPWHGFSRGANLSQLSNFNLHLGGRWVPCNQHHAFQSLLSSGLVGLACTCFLFFAHITSSPCLR